MSYNKELELLMCKYLALGLWLENEVGYENCKKIRNTINECGFIKIFNIPEKDFEELTSYWEAYVECYKTIYEMENKHNGLMNHCTKNREKEIKSELREFTSLRGFMQ